MNTIRIMLFAFTACASANIFSQDASNIQPSRNDKMMRHHAHHTTNTHESHSARHSKIAHQNHPMHLHVVTDDQENVVGAYSIVGKTKEGYRHGSFYTNLNQTPVCVIESGRGTPAHISVPGATTNVVGYLNNPAYNESIGSPRRIMLCQYNMPMEKIRPMNKMEKIRPIQNQNMQEPDMQNQDMQEAVPTLMPAMEQDIVQVQEYREKSHENRRENRREESHENRREKRHEKRHDQRNR